MGADPAALRQVLESIADGAPVDRVKEQSERLQGGDRRLVPYLHLVADIAELHRSIGSEDDAGDGEARRPLSAGDVWGNVELLDRVGRGAFGEVWRARDVHLNAEVALKLLHCDRRDLASTPRLLSEGRALARLHHPHVVTVHGIEMHDGQIGLRMEFVRGRTLEAVLQAQGPFSAAEAAAIGADLCRALAEVHRAGLVHRDIKAQNVMRQEGGRIVLMDLGSGQLTSDRGPGGLAGTPLYLAPEVIAGAEATVRSDIYSLGVLLYHLVSGAYPYPAQTFAELEQRHAGRSPVSLRDIRPDVPESFARVIERAIAPVPEDRFDSAGAMAQALSTVDPNGGARLRRRTWIAGGVLSAIVLVSLGALATGWLSAPPASAPSAAVNRIAVLPFTTLNDNAELDVLARGIAMEVTASLGQIGAVKVVPWSFMKRFAAGRTLQDVASETKADTIVEGTIQRSSTDNPSALNVSVRVFRAGTGTLLWSQDFHTHTGGVMSLQAEIARRIAAHFRIALARREQMLLARFRDVPADAVELYLKGREAFEAYDGNFTVAIGYFRKVLEIDPAFADAHAALAECYALQSSFSGAASANEAYTRAVAAAERALALNPDLPEAYSARGFARALLAWDWTGAETDFRRALELDPNSAAAHGSYSNYLTIVGRDDAAIQEARLAEERAPLSPVTSRRVAWAYYMARRYHEAIEQLRRVLEMDPGYGPARTLLARAYAMVGWHEDAIREIEPVPKGFEAIAAQVYAQAGRAAQARKLLSAAVLPHNLGNPPYQVAAAFALLQDREHALSWLERAIAVRDSAVVHMARDPRLDPLRSDPRFQTLLASLTKPPR